MSRKSEIRNSTADTESDDIREGIGCLLQAVAIGLFFLLLSIADPIVAWIERQP